MFLAPTVSSLRFNRAERECQAGYLQGPCHASASKIGTKHPGFGLASSWSGASFQVGDKLRQRAADGLRQGFDQGIQRISAENFRFRRHRRPTQIRRPRDDEAEDRWLGV